MTMNNLIYVENEELDLMNTEQFPTMEIPSRLEEIFSFETLSSEFRHENFDTYFFHNLPVPRVSQILRKCINKDYLVQWAARVGSKNMSIVLHQARTVGTLVHQMIEHYLTTGDQNFNLPPIEQKLIDRAWNGFINFTRWLGRLHSMGYNLEKVIATELPVVCPYYGGTIDLVAQINGAVYIIDYKTSANISYEYILQTCAYMWMVNNGYSDVISHVHGIGIIRLDKHKVGRFEDLFLNEFIPYQREILDYYINTFAIMLNSYYNLANIEILFDNCKTNYNFKEVIEKGSENK